MSWSCSNDSEFIANHFVTRLIHLKEPTTNNDSFESRHRFASSDSKQTDDDTSLIVVNTVKEHVSQVGIL